MNGIGYKFLLGRRALANALYLALALAREHERDEVYNNFTKAVQEASGGVRRGDGFPLIAVSFTETGENHAPFRVEFHPQANYPTTDKPVVMERVSVFKLWNRRSVWNTIRGFVLCSNEIEDTGKCKAYVIGAVVLSFYEEPLKYSASEFTVGSFTGLSYIPLMFVDSDETLSTLFPHNHRDVVLGERALE